jgi:hypothetical protein
MKFETELLEHNILSDILGRVRDKRSIVILTGGYIEFCISRIIDEKLKNHKKINDDNRSFPLSVKLILLNEINLISDGLLKSLDAFRRLRNRAAHDAIFKINNAELIQICKHIEIDIEERSKSATKDSVFTEYLPITCLSLISELKNQNTKIIEKYTTPAHWHREE